MKAKILRAISILALICTFPLALFSCNTNDDPLDVTATPGSEQQSQSESVIATVPTDTVTVFKNGNYSAKLFYSETTEDKTAADRIKAALNTKTGKSISASTAFVSDDGTLDQSPAILVGNTAYTESKTVYDSLKDGEAVAKVVNGKYVIAYSNADILTTLLTKIEEKITNASAEEIVIDSTWNMSLASSTTNVKVGELPKFDGQSLGTAIDLGQGSKLYIMKNATQAKYVSYAADLEKAGYKLYTSNTISSNLFATYTTDKEIVNVSFLKNSSEVRIIVDNRDTIELPALKSANVYTKTSTPSFTMMGISDSGYPGGMSFIYKLADGTFFIIDGGICADRTGSDECKGDPSVNRLFATLQDLADDPNKIVISGWLITHIHNDHAGAFIDLAEKSSYLSKITIKQVIYSQPSNSDMQDNNQPKRLNWMPNALSKMGIKKTVKAHPGQVFYYADLKLTILSTHDIVKPDKIERHNNASIVSMVEFGNKKTLYLADAEGQHNEQLKKLYGSYLKADILQVAHHGYNNTNAGIIYEYVNPSIVLWPIQTSDFKGSGANVYNVDFNKKYFDKSGITHYCAGAANITFENFTTWAPNRQNWKP